MNPDHAAPSTDDQSASSSMVENLRCAAQRGELQVLYQPVVSLITGKISGMEALLRWHSPVLGPVSPVAFIPVAETSGLIDSIGLWVLRRVCADIRAMLDAGVDIPHVAVNISPVQFRDPLLVQHVRRALEDFQIEARRLHIEITESTLMDDVGRCEAMLHAFKALGLCLSLDDFGTGYSSLSYLKRYPFNKVKIDQSFVRDVATNPADAVIVNVIVAMAHGLGLEVIAEGVETEAQCEIMRTSVCDEIQGFFFSKPVELAAVQSLLLQGHQLPAHLLRVRAQPRTLLLVDDEPNVLASLKRLFRRDGYIVHTANTGAEGLAVLDAQRIDVIMSDQRMPGMSGVEFLRAAKIRHPRTIRIVLSGYAELQYVTEAINEGAIYRFLTKPWDDAQLKDQVQRAFEHSELQEKNQQLDMEIRASNRDLVAINRQLNEAIDTNRKQMDRNEVSLAIAREALQFVPMPIIGVDDEGLVIFANTTAEAKFAQLGPMIGMELGLVLPEVVSALGTTAEGEMCTLALDGRTQAFKWHRMGKTSRSQGKLVLFFAEEG